MTTNGFNRRSFLTGAGAAGAGLALAGSTLAGCTDESDVTDTTDSASKRIAATTEPFRGAHQSGIVTPAQDRMVFASLDVLTDDRSVLAKMLEGWTARAEAMTKGDLVPGGFGASVHEPTADTGEAYGLPPAHLTITIGYGPKLFDDRFGLSDRKPNVLEQFPHFRGDEIRQEISGGDLCVQACADDPVVAFHAIHDLIRAGVGVVTTRTMQVGFGRTSSTSTSQATARNLMGFKDGTRNLKAEQGDLIGKWVWAKGSGGQDWMEGGSYLGARKIKMLLENWDREPRLDQEDTFGRYKATGAAHGADSEFAKPDLKAKDADGDQVIPEDAHIRRVSPENNGGIHLLRRGYNYADGVDPVTGNLDSGLFFIAFTSEPGHFGDVLRKMTESDGLNEYIRHISSAGFACPRGLDASETWSDQLFA